MKKREFYFLFLIPFPILAFGLGYGQYRSGVQAERNAIMVRLFHHRFTSIKYRNGTVMMRPKLIIDSSWDFKTPKTLQVGDEFKMGNRHWKGTFIIQDIRPDTLTIQYKYSGESPARPGYWTGQIKLSIR